MFRVVNSVFSRRYKYTHELSKLVSINHFLVAFEEFFYLRSSNIFIELIL